VHDSFNSAFLVCVQEVRLGQRREGAVDTFASRLVAGQTVIGENPFAELDSILRGFGDNGRGCGARGLDT